MSGAYSIDVEVGNSPDDPDFRRFHCASLTNTWTVDRRESEVSSIVAQLGGEGSIKDVLPRRPNVKNIPEIEAYFGALAVQLKVLRLKIFQEFLSIPEDVTSAFGYVHESPFGQEIHSGELQKHARFLKQGGGRRYVRITKESKTGSLTIYRNPQSTNEAIGSFNLQPSNTKCELVPRVNNSFVVKNSNRQWVFQAANRKEFGAWLHALTQILGPSNVPKPPAAQGEEKEEVLKSVGAKDIPSLESESEQLKREIELMENQLQGMTQEVKNLRFDKEQLTKNKAELKIEIEKEFQRETEELIKDYKIQNDNLKEVIIELEAALTAKPSVANVAPPKFSLGNFFGKKDEDSKESANDAANEIEQLIQIDIERKMLRQLHENEKSQVKHTHKHLHKHSHKHVHEHRHTHIDKDMKEQGQIPDDIEFVNKHKLVHNITHTNTQMILEGAKALGVRT